MGRAGNSYPTRKTVSTDFPTSTGSGQSASGGNEDAFVSKFNPRGDPLVYSTLLGGVGNHRGRGVAMDGDKYDATQALVSSELIDRLRVRDFTRAQGTKKSFRSDNRAVLTHLVHYDPSALQGVSSISGRLAESLASLSQHNDEPIGKVIEL